MNLKNTLYVLITLFLFLISSCEEEASLKRVVAPKLPSEETLEVEGELEFSSDYVYNLNVVYFVPLDKKANPEYTERISEILLEGQEFMAHWMQRWGFERKSYGLLKTADNKRIQIITVKGLENANAYNYKQGADKMQKEIDAYYKDNKLKSLSEHYLVIQAINQDMTVDKTKIDVPFFGRGKWCYAIDFTNMSLSRLKSGADKTNWIGGLLHEMGHGLNLPHVGACCSHRYEKADEYGIPLMSHGNTTFGKSPTYFHETSAAILNNSQAGAKVKKQYYNKYQVSDVKLSSVKLNGAEVTVKGEFMSMGKVNGVIVRFFDATEPFLGGSAGYSSVAFLVKPPFVDNKFEITVPIRELSKNGRTASYVNAYKIGLTILNDNGTTAHEVRSDIFELKDNNGNFTLQRRFLDRSKWTVEASHKLPEDALIQNSLKSLVDNNERTCLSLVKPGKTYNGISVPADADVFVVVDTKVQTKFNALSLVFRADLNQLRARKISLYGSNDNNNFELIKNDIVIETKKNSIDLKFDATNNYRYVKMVYLDWDKTSGNTIQFAEFIPYNIK